ncbi:MAG: hypothetical protein JSV19_09925 [Phycisphaerales bacterium]|nr:MAG: hypothetical protein JSV19_09925 [Phycisphaerales bacterium]
MNTGLAGREGKPTAEEQAMFRDYEAALRTVRSARGVFLVLLTLSLLVHVAAFCAVRWGHILTVVDAAEEEIASSDVSVIATGEPENAQNAADAKYMGTLLQTLLPLAEFIGQASCALLALCFLASGQICLAGGLGGVRGSLSAFFWMLVLLALLFPWGRWLSGVQIPGVFLTFAELEDFSPDFDEPLHEVLSYVRFLGYPALALLIALVGDSRYARGYRLVRRHLEARLHVRPI